MTRLQDFYDHLRNEELSQYEMYCCLTNGDIDAPEWLSYRDNGDELQIFDVEEPDIGFISIVDDRDPDYDEMP